MKSYIKIKNGSLETFDGDFRLEEIFEVKKVERVSHIVPKNIILRMVFRLIRKLFGDKGKMADWTRKWNVEWIVIFGPFTERKEAIIFEREAYTAYTIKKEVNS